MSKPNINTSTYWDSVYELEIKQGIVRFEIKSGEEIVNLIGQWDSVLDYGCGTGALTRFINLKRPEAYVVGFDFSKVAIDYCISQNQENFYTTAIDDFDPQSFNVVILSHVIEHMDLPS